MQIDLPQRRLPRPRRNELLGVLAAVMQPHQLMLKLQIPSSKLPGKEQLRQPRGF